MADDELGILQEKVRFLRELEKHPGWVVLRDELESIIEAHRRRMDAGTYNDLMEYKLNAGKLQGMQVPLVLAYKLEQQMYTMLEQEKHASGQ